MPSTKLSGKKLEISPDASHEETSGGDRLTPDRRRLFWTGVFLLLGSFAVQWLVSPVPKILGWGNSRRLVAWSVTPALIVNAVTSVSQVAGGAMVTGTLLGALTPAGWATAVVTSAGSIVAYRIWRVPFDWVPALDYWRGIERWRSLPVRDGVRYHAYWVNGFKEHHCFLTLGRVPGFFGRSEEILAERSVFYMDLEENPTVVLSLAAEAAARAAQGNSESRSGIETVVRSGKSVFAVDTRAAEAYGLGQVVLAYDLEKQTQLPIEGLCNLPPFFSVSSGDLVDPRLGQVLDERQISGRSECTQLDRFRLDQNHKNHAVREIVSELLRRSLSSESPSSVRHVPFIELLVAARKKQAELAPPAP